MALSHDKEWIVQADKAMKRKKELNTPWPTKWKCMICGTDKDKPSVNPLVCESCIRAAFDVIIGY